MRGPLFLRPLCQLCEAGASRYPVPTATRYLRIDSPTQRSPTKRWKTWVTRDESVRRPVVKAVQYAPRPNRRFVQRYSTGPDVDSVVFKNLPNLEKITRAMMESREEFDAKRGIPSEDDAAAILNTCAKAARTLMDSKVQHLLRNKHIQPDTAASNLLDLDSSSSRFDTKNVPVQPTVSMTKLRDVMTDISDTAFFIIAHPNVFISPKLLEIYVSIQSRLGKTESLPHVFRLYASKPSPREANGSIAYVRQNPNKISNAVDQKVAEKALDAAIEAKNLDAAIGIVEDAYASKASIRAKLFKKGMIPAAAITAFPIAAWTVASQLSHLQDSMDQYTATGIVFAGLLAYFGFTGAIGVVATATANDQMIRVTWARGTPLRSRWLREEERAALDKIACSFGFSEYNKFGEEEGAQFQALREYILQKGMILDQIDLMEGMGG